MRRGIVTLAAVALVAGCTAGTPEPDRADQPTVGMRLVAFDSCADALADLRAAAKKSVNPFGLPGSLRDVVSAEGAAGQVYRTASAPPEHSTTNNHEAAADEPDQVKTDGTRIVTLTDDTLRVVDPARRAVTGTLALDTTGGPGRDATEGDWTGARLLLHGDRAVVFLRLHGMPGGRSADRVARPGPLAGGTKLFLVDLTGTPRVTGTYRIEGELVEARKVGDTARVVVRSYPDVAFPALDRDATDEERITANRAAIDQTPVETWLPRYEWTDGGGARHDGRLPCDRLSRPDGHSASAVLSLLSFDLGVGGLTDGEPVGVVAEGDTVYGTDRSLYVADRLGVAVDRTTVASLAGRPLSTEIHRFDLTAPGRPRYVASGTVPGYLVSQYAISEWEGHLRVATTIGSRRTGGETSSGVYVLRTDGPEMRRVGAVTGLGRDEEIFAVRYLGAAAYLVTFRQTDPLYALDLSDPTAPRTTGELKITGFSRHLQPLAGGRLLGVGQEADRRGRAQGLLVSLFDVTDPAKPTRIARYDQPELRSTADHDPKALLYWPATGLLVLPVVTHEWAGRGAVVLRADGTTLTEVGRITHPGDERRAGIERSLMVGDTLWTVSGAGLKATDPGTLADRAWLPTT
ncbi:beta-propeller domain-containing protein [Micromonospora sp. WMMD882]|uniref:beta-propeller domain-containing protein n=1 Tax=Micromonospora sp. WMMD882 TaxID=3015151 RepID=UPI00248B07E7|nr:beta-propeller domain-containing protein [Micromonospora sp. WMMD882]WBB78377.1 beta-propeller domain-containing protein [Micromonospora sp. WMMD882]